MPLRAGEGAEFACPETERTEGADAHESCGFPSLNKRLFCEEGETLAGDFDDLPRVPLKSCETARRSAGEQKAVGQPRVDCHVC